MHAEADLRGAGGFATIERLGPVLKCEDGCIKADRLHRIVDNLSSNRVRLVPSRREDAGTKADLHDLLCVEPDRLRDRKGDDLSCDCIRLVRSR